MRCLVVFESVTGNTAQIARAVGDGLSGHGEVTVADVRGARPEYAERFDLLVVGGPSRAFSLTRGLTLPHPAHPRQAGHRLETGLRDWLRMLPVEAYREVAASFDVRVLDTLQDPGSTARRAAHMLRHLGYQDLVEPASFYVKQPGGPLVPGERARAASWGERLGALMPSAR